MSVSQSRRSTIASLQYRHVCEYAVGHGVAVEAAAAVGGDTCELSPARHRDGLPVVFVDGTGQDARMSPSNFFTYSWPWRACRPRIYYDARADTADASSTMHAKCVIGDDREVLITSANFTGRAQHDNVELSR